MWGEAHERRTDGRAYKRGVMLNATSNRGTATYLTVGLANKINIHKSYVTHIGINKIAVRGYCVCDNDNYNCNDNGKCASAERTIIRLLLHRVMSSETTIDREIVLTRPPAF